MRESSRTACSVVPNCSEVGEGVFIVSLEIWPLQLVHLSISSRNPVNRAWDRAVRRRGRSDRARGRTVRSKPELGPGLDRGRSLSRRNGLWLSPKQVSVGAGASGPRPGPTGRATGPGRSRPDPRPGHHRAKGKAY